ncbi:MAG: hypothetical protein NC112_00575 [Oxalobacter formigenes]|nr:hypothetical protein [Oxalobacter formigenes]
MGLTVDPFRKAAYTGTDAVPSRQEKTGGKSDFARVLDEVKISSQGREALAVSGRAAAPGGASRPEDGNVPDNGGMGMQAAVVPNRADFDAQAAKAGAENRLETNWNAVVDPDGSIYSAAYVGAIVSQYQKAEAAVRDYYSSPYQESLPFDNAFNPLPEKGHEPAGADQERSVLWGDNLRLNDLYELSSSGGTLHIDDVDRIARSAAQAKLDALIKDWKAAHGITD